MMTEQYVGRVLDRRYQILEFIASGGMAQVFRAVHVGTGRPLAVKILKPKARGNPDNIRRFQREARLTATLEHANIIDIIDVQTDEEVYLVMELLAGVDLRVYLRRMGRLPWTEVRAIMLQICDAMQFAHDRGVVHRDLKPANCFRVEPGGRIKVLDLGIARPIAPLPGDPSRITLTGIPTGTPAYMAPEHFCGQADVQTDIWSAGVLMFELLTGRRPFVGEDAELLRQIVNSPMPALRCIADVDCPADTEAVIECALAKLPEQRYTSMRAFAGAITALDAEPVTRILMSQARPTLSLFGAETHTTIALVRLAAPEPPEPAESPHLEPLAPDPPELTASPLPEPLAALPDPPRLAASPLREPLEAPPVAAPRPVRIEAPQPVVIARSITTSRRWLGGLALVICLTAAGLAQLWRAREPSEPALATLVAGTPVAEPIDRVDQPSVAHASILPPDLPPGDAATPPTTQEPQFVVSELVDAVHVPPSAKPSPDVADIHAPTSAPVNTSRSDADGHAPTSLAAETLRGAKDVDPPTSPASTRDAKPPTSPPPAASPGDAAPPPPASSTAEDIARARQKRQRAAERAVQGVLVSEGVGALLSRVKVTVQWSAAGEVIEAIVDSLPGGAERTGVEARLRELSAPPGAGPVRVDRFFELALPE